MVRDTFISIATLAGLVGLATIYNNGTSNNIVGRSARAVEDDIAIDNLDLNENHDDVFAEDFHIDVQMFQNDDDQEMRAGGAKKQINQVKNCLKNDKCTERAQESVKKWAEQSERYIAANPTRLLKAVTTSYVAAENDFGFCTESDDAVPCDGSSADPLAFYKSNHNDNPKEQYSANANIQSMIEDLAVDSTAMNNALDSMKVGEKDYRNKNSAFTQRAAKVFLVIPNGVPVSMPDDYPFRFGNYWRWFKQFNQKYIGITVPGGINRVNTHFWFLRQDKILKTIMKTPAKTSNRFPWRRFDNIMLPNQNTAAQPKVANTFQALWNTIDSKGMSSETNEGQDCFTLWFHQYIPADILDLSDSLFQEEYLLNLEKACTIIHVWVGMTALGDSSTAKVAQYIQGILQPEQLSYTSVDPQHRRYYFIESLESLGGDEGEELMHNIYNDIALERARATCLLASSAHDLGAVFDENQNRYDEYYTYGEDSTTSGYDAGTTQNSVSSTAVAYDVTYAADETTAYESGQTTAEDLGPADYKCCGIGFGGKKYDTKTEACCEDGSTAASEADCFLL